MHYELMPETLAPQIHELPLTVSEVQTLSSWIIANARAIPISRRSTTLSSQATFQRVTSPILNPQHPELCTIPGDVMSLTSRLYLSAYPLIRDYFSRTQGDLELLHTRHAVEGTLRLPGDPVGERHFDYVPTAVVYLSHTSAGGELEIEGTCLQPPAPSLFIFDGVSQRHAIQPIPHQATGARTAMTFSYWLEPLRTDPLHPRQIAYDQWRQRASAAS